MKNSFFSGKIIESLFFFLYHGKVLDFFKSWKAEKYSGRVAFRVLDCGIPEISPYFHPQSAEIWPLLKILEATLLWNRYVSAQNGHDHNNSNKMS